MFIQFKKLNNESGIVLFMVLMTAIIIMIFSVGMLSQSMNEINYAQQQIDQITADQLAKGIYWNAYAPNFVITSNITTATPLTEYQNEDGGSTMIGRNYQITVAQTAPIQNAITNYSVTVNYDTFQ